MKTFHKKLTMLFIGAIAAVALSALSFQKVSEEPYLVKEFTLSGTGNLIVETPGGSIKVFGHESNTVRVEMHLQLNGEKLAMGDSKAAELLKDYEISIIQAANTITAQAKNKNHAMSWKKKNLSIGFTVFVPNNMSSKLQTSGGTIHLEGVKGTQEVETSGGSLSFKSVEGKLTGHTSGGSIEISNYTGLLNVHTSGGSIRLQDSSGDLTVHTSGGSIDIEDVKGSIDASTSGGSIHATLITIDKQVKLHTSGGNIKAVLPSGVGLDLDLQGNKVNTKLQNFEGEIEDDSIKGSMNGGGIPVVMSSSGGNVTVEYQ